MARIAGVDIPRDKRTVVSLTYILGVGKTTAEKMCSETKIDGSTKVKDLNEEEVVLLRTYIEENIIVEGDLRRETSENITRKKDINCYQGVRHSKGLPVKGQRTHTNARTRKGPRKAIAGKKKILK